MNLEDKLLELYQKKRLGHFYLVNPSGHKLDPQSHFLQDWIQVFLTEVLKREGKTSSIKNSPDILRIGLGEQEKKKAFYQLEDFSPLYPFLEMKPFELPHRFVIVSQTHKITETIANKLLKILEEPQGNVTIFFLNPIGSKSLPTIESRALKLRVATQEKIQDNCQQVQTLQKRIQSGELPYIEFAQEFKGKEDELTNLMSFYSFEDTADSAGQYLELIKHGQESKQLNQSANERLLGWYHFLAQDK